MKSVERNIRSTVEEGRFEDREEEKEGGKEKENLERGCVDG